MAEKQADSLALSAALVEKVEASTRRHYEEFRSHLPFHGWHHIEFVRSKAVMLAGRNGADGAVVEVAALLHDLNYMVKRNSRVAEARNLRAELLGDLGVAGELIARIETVIAEAETEARDADVSLEAQALSDADTMFKALPVTPVLLAHKYMAETGQSLRELCDRILRDQVPLRDQGIYFYDDEVRHEFEEWSNANLHLWECIDAALQHSEVRDLVRTLESPGPQASPVDRDSVPGSPETHGGTEDPGSTRD